MRNTYELFAYLDEHEGEEVILDNEHTIVKKIMNIDEERLIDYINRLKRARKDGVNIVSVVDYQILSRTKKRRSNIIDGLYVLNRTYGKEYENKRVIKVNVFDNVVKKCNDYFEQNRIYMEELETRCNAPQEQFDKLVSDLIKLHLLGINQSNTAYDTKEGFTIVDGIFPIEPNTYHTIAIQVIDAIMGKGRPVMLVNDCYVECLPSFYAYRYSVMYEVIIPKIIRALMKNEVHPDFFSKVITKKNGLLNYNGYIAKNKEDIYRLIIKNDRIKLIK